ncbi:S1C family serine protease [Actinomyces marmotae]|uniref:S1C family serine protease n=1 Tax=Actinomyces marmotae TaxID=2737173 RepID=UPI001359E898|nr:trypsin-like peptidase domain-containing protein [Actinomyces marmotae]
MSNYDESNGQPTGGASATNPHSLAPSDPAPADSSVPAAARMTDPAAPTETYTSAPTAPAGYDFGPGSQPGHYPTTDAFAAPTTDAFAAPPAMSAVDGGAPVPAAPTKERRGPGWGSMIAMTVAAALLASGGTFAAFRHDTDGASTPKSAGSSPTAVATGSTTQTVTSQGTTPDWQAVTAAVSNSVVSITVSVGNSGAVGSGVIYDSKGHILTNQHVVAGASKIMVTLADGRIYGAEVTGTDASTDLAVIKLKDAPSDLTVAQIGDSDSLATGQGVMAIGNPLGLSSTVTTGIISALDRPVVTTREDTGDPSKGSDPSQQGPQSGDLGGLLNNLFDRGKNPTSQVYTNAIQIDAAINPGNSGGPLFDGSGKVIGITSSIASTGRSGSSGEKAGSIGIGFAIPVKLAQKVADQLIATGSASHAYLGVSIGDGGAEADGVLRAGAEVGSVEQGSPAANAGVKQGDVITAINGKKTNQAAALTGFVRQYSAGDEVTLTVIRGGKSQEIKVTLAEKIS